MRYLTISLKNYFKVLRNQDLKSYIGSQLFWQIGIWILNNAYALLIFNITEKSAKSLGYINLAMGLGVVFASLVLNDLPNKFNKLSIIRYLQRIQIFGTSLVAGLLLSGVLKDINQYEFAPAVTAATIILYVMSFINGNMSTVYFITNQLFLKDLVGAAQIKKAVGVNAIVVNTCRFLGPALAGFLIDWLDYGYAYLFAAILFLPISYFLKKLQRKEEYSTIQSVEKTDFMHTLSLIFSDFRLRGLFLTNILIGFFAFPIFMLAPAFAEGNARLTGMLLSASGFASILCVLLIIPVLSKFKSTGRTISMATMWTGAWLIILSLNQNIYWGMMCFFMAGMGNTVFIVLSLSSVQLVAPRKYQAKTLSILNITVFASQPVATTILGHLVDAYGLMIVINFTAVIGFVSCLGMFLIFKKWRNWCEE